MKIQVEICDESKDKIFLDDMKWQIDNMKQDLETMKETKKGSGFKSWDYREDKEAVKRMLNSFEMVFDYYGGNI